MLKKKKSGNNISARHFYWTHDLTQGFLQQYVRESLDGANRCQVNIVIKVTRRLINAPSIARR